MSDRRCYLASVTYNILFVADKDTDEQVLRNMARRHLHEEIQFSPLSPDDIDVKEADVIPNDYEGTDEVPVGLKHETMTVSDAMNLNPRFVKAQERFKAMLGEQKQS